MLRGFADPQGALANASIAGGALFASLAPDTAGRHALIFGDAVTEGGLPQTIMFKVDVAPSPPPPPPPPAAALTSASWAFVPVAFNGDLQDIFREGAYTSPRPETCAVRLGSDGWSAWTFSYWNGPWAPTIDFSDVANLTVAPGIIATPQGARFALGNVTVAPRSGALNAAFVTLWDAYPNATVVPITATDAAGATGVFVLLAGSTNPMQTRIANAELRFRLADGSALALELVPPLNYWGLAGWGSADYDYTATPFCLPPVPPPTVRLGAANRAMVYYSDVPSGATIAAVELEALSQEVVIALLAVSIAK
jgi:hypothetical protein